MCPVFFRFNDLAVILLANGFREALCPADFIVAFFLAEANRKGLIYIGNGCHIAGVNAAGEERANFYIGDFMSLYRVVERVGNLVYPVIQRRLFVCMEFDFPVLLNVQLAIFIDEIMCRRQLVNAFEECFCARRILECQVIFKGSGIQHLFKVRMRQETLDFRAKQECFSHLCIVQRLDAEEISCPEQGFLLFVPDDKGEHPTQFLKQCCAVFLIAVD